MPRATECILGNDRISVKEAIQLRDIAETQKNKKPDFRCVECGRPVKPHKGGGTGGAHFEHLERNPKCSLSDPAR